MENQDNMSASVDAFRSQQAASFQQDQEQKKRLAMASMLNGQMTDNGSKGGIVANALTGALNGFMAKQRMGGGGGGATDAWSRWAGGTGGMGD